MQVLFSRKQASATYLSQTQIQVSVSSFFSLVLYVSFPYEYGVIFLTDLPIVVCPNSNDHVHQVCCLL